MKKKFIAIIIACLVCAEGYTQLEASNWFFGDSVLLKFSLDSIIVSKAFLSSTEATSVISDINGELLYYTNTGFVYNVLHEPIHEEPIFGYSYNPFDPSNGNNSPEWSLILNSPENPDTLFFLLTMDSTLSFTKIDRRLNDGKGGIDDSAINVLLGDTAIPMDTKLTSTRHANGRDWWIFMRSHCTAEVQFFLRWLLKPEGFEGPDYIELTDWVEEEGWQFGNMFFSQDGKQLIVLERDGFEVYDFDRCSGELEQVAIIQESFVDNFHYAALNGNGTRLYISYANYETGSIDANTGILQYNLELLPDPDAVLSSAQVVFEENYSLCGVKALKYEPITDNIYFTIVTKDSVYSHNLYLHAITAPDNLGLTCNPVEGYLQIASGPGGMRTLEGLPNMPNYALGALEGSPCDTLNETNSVAEATSLPFKAYPNPVQDYLYIDNPLQTTCQAVVYNAMGQEVASLLVQPGGQTLNTSAWSTGVYQLIIQQESDNIWKQSLIKLE